MDILIYTHHNFKRIDVEQNDIMVQDKAAAA